MLKYHIQKKKEADATIGVFEVSLSDAPSFGIMNMIWGYDHLWIWRKTERAEKYPASMGIYIFKWKVLNPICEKDEKDKKSSNDFEKYPEYVAWWKEAGSTSVWRLLERCGTIQSFWMPIWTCYKKIMNWTCLINLGELIQDKEFIHLLM